MKDKNWRGPENRKSEGEYTGACEATGGEGRRCKMVGRRGGENFCFISFRIYDWPV